MIDKRIKLRQKMRQASAAGSNARASRLAERLDKAGGNSVAASKRITRGLQAKDARGQLRSAIRSGDRKSIRGASRAVRATNTGNKRLGAAMRIKKSMGYK